MIMRDYYLDSCKAVLIFLVVLGHFLERMIGWKDPISHMFLGTIYFIHMPAFIFISGMLFKDKNWLKNALKPHECPLAMWKLLPQMQKRKRNIQVSTIVMNVGYFQS